jgi:short-chain fatty acids transporter
MDTQHPGTRLDRLAYWIARLVPDAITASVILTLTMFGVALALGNSFGRVMDAYSQGLWMLLSFTMQMTLIIVLSSTLAATPFLRRSIASLARIPKTSSQLVALAFVSSGVASYCYWGLGYALGPILAIHFAKEGERKGLRADFPFLIATTYGAQALWQFGLSSSGPLLVATPGHFLESIIGVVPLSTTIWSPAAILHEVAYAAAAIALACWLMPKVCRPLSQFPESAKLTETAESVAEDRSTLSPAERLERGPLVPLVICSLMASWIFHHFRVKHLGIDINTLNATLLFLTFFLHRSVKRFARAVQQSMAGSWAVVVLYHLYAGVAGLIQYTNAGEKVASMAASISTAATFPIITAIASSIFACFIPSSGGQWTVQGFITVKTAMAVGVSVQRGMLSLGVGDHMGNFLTPFWYVVVASIARVDFRCFFGYGLVFAALWFAIGGLVFTFAPC